MEKESNESVLLKSNLVTAHSQVRTVEVVRCRV